MIMFLHELKTAWLVGDIFLFQPAPLTDKKIIRCSPGSSLTGAVFGGLQMTKAIADLVPDTMLEHKKISGLFIEKTLSSIKIMNHQ